LSQVFSAPNKKTIMKNLLLLLLTLFSVTLLHAQEHPLTQYGFAVDQEEYRPLDMDYVGYTEIDALDDWSMSSVSIGFDFELGGKAFSQVMALTDGDLSFEDFINHPESVIAASVFAANLIDKDVNTDENSLLRYVVDGNAGNRILKIEYNNLGLATGAPEDYVNFQVWLYEGSNSIEYRYGPMQINDPGAAFGGVGGIVAGLAELEFNNETFSGLLLKNDPTEPDTVLLQNAEQLFGLNLQGFPEEGTLYRFCPQGVNCAGAATATLEAGLVGKSVQLFPNPANQYCSLTFELEGKADCRVEIFSLLGAASLGTVPGELLPG
jgi:hypothetical protein